MENIKQLEERISFLENVIDSLVRAKEPNNKVAFKKGRPRKSSKPLTIADVLDADESLKECIGGCIIGGFQKRKLVQYGGVFDKLREEFNRRGWKLLSKDDYKNATSLYSEMISRVDAAVLKAYNQKIVKAGINVKLEERPLKVIEVLRADPTLKDCIGGSIYKAMKDSKCVNITRIQDVYDAFEYLGWGKPLTVKDFDNFDADVDKLCEDMTLHTEKVINRIVNDNRFNQSTPYERKIDLEKIDLFEL